MIKFEILESLNYRGGNHYCDFYAKRPSDVVQALKDAWHGSGISKHGGELFLNAYLNDADGNKIELFFGNCNFDKSDKLYFNFVSLVEEAEYEPWYALGLFLVDEEQNFSTIQNALFDFDSPDRVLGSYIYKVAQKIEQLSQKERTNFDLNVIANILEFGHSQGKLHELFMWIFSESGIEYFDELPHVIDMQRPELVRLSVSTKVEELSEFILQFKKNFGIKIYLPSKH
jgi:hypothetical protein